MVDRPKHKFTCPFCPKTFKHRDSLEARKKRFAHVVAVHKKKETSEIQGAV